MGRKIYGYGFLADGARDATEEQIRNLLEHAPNFKSIMDVYYNCFGIQDVTVEHYLDYDDEHRGVLYLLQQVIEEAEKIYLEIVNDCLLFEQRFPWMTKYQREKVISEKELDGIFRKYLSMLTERVSCGMYIEADLTELEEENDD